jgi:hypothetical protein
VSCNGQEETHKALLLGYLCVEYTATTTSTYHDLSDKGQTPDRTNGMSSSMDSKIQHGREKNV